MIARNPSNNYKEYQIKTSSSQELVVLLYEENIRLLNRILEHFKFIKTEEKIQNNINYIQIEKYKVEIHHDLIKVQNIINELSLGLDFKANPEFAKKMESLYAYMYNQLVKANIKKEEKYIEEVKKYIEELVKAWKLVLKNSSSSNEEKEEIRKDNVPRLDMLT